jgi:hypothetical protein
MAGLLLAATPHLVARCADEKPKNHYTLKEAIDVEGTCWENHMGQKDKYAGQIVRWETVETRQVMTYGFVSFSFEPKSLAERAFDEATHPTVYHTPSMIEFKMIDIDTRCGLALVRGAASASARSASIPVA